MAAPANVERIGGWEVRAHNGRMTSSRDEDELSAELRIKLPTMVFPSSELVLHRAASKFSLAFRAREALACVGRADPSIRVRAAAAWAGKEERTDVAVSQLESPSDWTFTTHYAGDVSGGEEVTVGDMQRIDFDALRNRDIPIKFFAEVVLFEDELDDNGTASYKVRIVRCVLLPRVTHANAIKR